MRGILTFVVVMAIAGVIAGLLDGLGLGFIAGFALGVGYLLVASFIINTWGRQS